MVTGMIEGMVAVDGDDRVTFSNDAARKMLHLDAKSPGFEPSKRSRQRIWEQAKIAGLDALVSAARRSDSAAQCELELSSTDEDTVVRAQAHRFQDGDSVGVVIVLEDVSGIRRLERIRRDFVASVSHVGSNQRSIAIREVCYSDSSMRDRLLGRAHEWSID